MDMLNSAGDLDPTFAYGTACRARAANPHTLAFHLRGKSMRTETSLFGEVEAAMQLPPNSGRVDDLDILFRRIGQAVSWQPDITRFVLVISDSGHCLLHEYEEERAGFMARLEGFTADWVADTNGRTVPEWVVLTKFGQVNAFERDGWVLMSRVPGKPLVQTPQ